MRQKETKKKTQEQQTIVKHPHETSEFNRFKANIVAFKNHIEILTV